MIILKDTEDSYQVTSRSCLKRGIKEGSSDPTEISRGEWMDLVFEAEVLLVWSLSNVFIGKTNRCLTDMCTVSVLIKTHRRLKSPHRADCVKQINSVQIKWMIKLWMEHLNGKKNFTKEEVMSQTSQSSVMLTHVITCWPLMTFV